MLDLTEPGGEKLRDALRRVGGDPDRLAEAKRSDISAYLELHIEQGVVLECRALDVGIVTSIVGIRRIEIVFQGEADHAGTTPMELRHDALVAAAAHRGIGAPAWPNSWRPKGRVILSPPSVSSRSIPRRRTSCRHAAG